MMRIMRKQRISIHFLSGKIMLRCMEQMAGSEE